MEMTPEQELAQLKATIAALREESMDTQDSTEGATMRRVLEKFGVEIPYGEWMDRRQATMLRVQWEQQERIDKFLRGQS
jgi:hypothetical protein